MNNPYIVEIGLHWAAAIVYVGATLFNSTGVIFSRAKAERVGHLLAWTGLVLHSAALGYRWWLVGYGPYVVKYEIISSLGWMALVLYFVFSRLFPRMRAVSLLVFPAAFLLVAIALIFDPAGMRPPATLDSFWLVLHVTFYKIAVTTLLIGLTFSLALLWEPGNRPQWLARLPDERQSDSFAHRFAGFGFTFWGIAMLTGAVWAFESWGRFWAWDPLETWSLITWLFLGLYLHLRRFFHWQGRKAAWLYIVCILITIFSFFFVPLFDDSLHSVYFQ